MCDVCNIMVEIEVPTRVIAKEETKDETKSVATSETNDSTAEVNRLWWAVDYPKSRLGQISGYRGQKTKAA